MNGKVAARAVSYLRTPVLEANVKQIAKGMNRIAVESKAVAQDLVQEGLRSNVTPSFLKKMDRGGTFDALGNLTEKGREAMSALLKRHNLPKNATVQEFMQALKNYCENPPKFVLPKIELPKFLNKKPEIDVTALLAKFKEQFKNIDKTKEEIRIGIGGSKRPFEDEIFAKFNKPDKNIFKKFEKPEVFKIKNYNS